VGQAEAQHPVETRLAEESAAGRTIEPTTVEAFAFPSEEYGGLAEVSVPSSLLHKNIGIVDRIIILFVAPLVFAIIFSALILKR